MKVVMVSTFPPRRCGIGDYASDLVGALSRQRDLELVVLTYRDGTNQEPTSSPGFEITRELDDRLTVARAMSLLRRHEPDLIHFQSATFLHRAAVNRSIARACRQPLVTTVHDSPMSWRLPYAIPSLREIYGRSSRLIVHSGGVADVLRDFHHIEPEKIKRMGIGVDTTRFSPGVDDRPFRELWSIGHRRVVLFLGFLRPGKGVEVLLEAWGRIEQQLPDTVLVVVGGTPTAARRYALLLRDERDYPRRLMQLTEHLGIAKRVIFAGYVDTNMLPSAVSSGSIVVLPYLGASQSAVLPEILSSGKPIVATRIPGFLGMLENGKNAVLVAPGDPVSLADRICYLLANPDQASQLASGARRFAEESCSLSKVATATRELYHEVCS